MALTMKATAGRMATASRRSSVVVRAQVSRPTWCVAVQRTSLLRKLGHARWSPVLTRKIAE